LFSLSVPPAVFCCGEKGYDMFLATKISKKQVENI
jgi:hypothetical protein